MTSRVTLRMARDLRKAAARNKAPIWARLAEHAESPSSARRDINVNRVGRLTKEGDTVAFPGKVLGTGSIGHGITLFSFSISAQAASKIAGAGGSVIGHEALIEGSPTGRGVVLLG